MTDNDKQKIVEKSCAYIVKLLTQITDGKPIESKFVPPEGFINEQIIVSAKTEKGQEIKIPVDHLSPKQNSNGRIIIHYHGGAYVCHLPDAYRLIATKYSLMAGGAEVFSVDYRISPPDTHPAALEDAVEVYKYLLAKGYKNDKIIIIGDSAGGHLGISSTLYLKEKNIPLPKVVICFAPWVNPACDFPSIKGNWDKDLLLGSKGVGENGHANAENPYFKGADLKNDPYASPIYGDFKGFPNLLIQVGGYDLILDDAKAIYEKAKKDGCNANLTIYPEMPHVFQLFIKDVEETNMAWLEMKKFVDSYV